MKNLILTFAFCSFTQLAFAHGEREMAKNQKLDLSNLEKIEEDPDTEMTQASSPEEEQEFNEFRRLVEKAYKQLQEENSELPLY